MKGLRLVCLMLLAACASCGGDAKQHMPLRSGDNPGGLVWPVDRLLAGEELNSEGHVVPAANDWLVVPRSVSGINESSELVLGAQRYDAVGAVTDLGQASRLTASGNAELAAAVYRITLGGSQPAAVSADVNLHLAGAGLANYWLAVADYGAQRWEMYGPFSESHVRLSLSAVQDYTSPLGNAFVAVIASGDSQVDVVSVGANARGGDVTSPAAPAALGATPVAGGLLLEWTGVIASDLAGYRIYYSYSPFTAVTDNGVSSVNFVEGHTRHLLRLASNRLVYVAVASVDIDGNASALSSIVSDFTLAGAPPPLEVTTSVAGGEVGVVATLTASGAQTYDFDLDGDGDFEISGNTTGTAQIITDQPGIVRPAVRGTGPAGTAVALGSVSLILTGNPPPLAVLTAGDTQLVLGDVGNIETTLDASLSADPLGESLTFAFDPEGDGSYVVTGATASFTASYIYSGVHQAKVRVTDSAGNSTYDSVLISVRRFGTQTLSGAGDYPSAAIINGTPAVAFIFNDNLIYRRAYDAEGRDWAPSVTVHDAANAYDRNCSLVEVGGLPAIAYFDTTAGDLLYRLATTPTGEVWNSAVIVDTTAHTTRGISMAIVNGNPAIAFNDSQSERLRFARSSAANGYPQATWTTIDVSLSPDIGIRPSLAVINGNPAISSLRSVEFQGNRLGYVRANDANGTDWGVPFSIFDPDNSDQDGGRSSLLEVAGHPAIAFRQFDGSQADVWYVRATTDNGETAAEWGSFVPVSVNDEDHGDDVAMAIVGGKPAVVFWDKTNDAIRYVRSTTITGNTPAAWPTTSARVHALNLGHFTVDLVAAGSLPIAVFYNGSVDVAVPRLE